MTTDDLMEVVLGALGVSSILTEQDDRVLWGYVLLHHLPKLEKDHPGHAFNLKFGTADGEVLSQYRHSGHSSFDLWILERVGNQIFPKRSVDSGLDVGSSGGEIHPCNTEIVISRPSINENEALVLSGAYAPLDGGLALRRWCKEQNSRIWSATGTEETIVQF